MHGKVVFEVGDGRDGPDIGREIDVVIPWALVLHERFARGPILLDCFRGQPKLAEVLAREHMLGVIERNNEHGKQFAAVSFPSSVVEVLFKVAVLREDHHKWEDNLANLYDASPLRNILNAFDVAENVSL